MNHHYYKQRQDMINGQIISRGISNGRVLDSMSVIPRELFVPRGEQDMSYSDQPLPIGFEQTISQPYIVAYMTEMLELAGDEKVLELGTGSGYQTAVLARIVREVYTVEVIESLSTRAEELLVGDLKYSNIYFKKGNGRQGWNEMAPFDRIIVTAAARSFPEQLLEQLNLPGIAIAPVGDFFQSLVKIRKTQKGIEEEQLIGVSFVPLV